MPELPEVEALSRNLRREAVGAVIRKAEVLLLRAIRPHSPDDFSRAVGRRIEGVTRRGKNVLIELSGGLALRAHMGMTGDLFVIPDARLRSASTRVIFLLKDGRGLVFEDARTLGCMNIHEVSDLPKVLKHLGVEPLIKTFTPELLIEMATRSKQPAKLFLMDQSRIAGIGNIY